MMKAEVRLGAKATNYVEKSLPYCGILGQSAQEHIRLDDGQLICWMPEDTETEEIVYEWGGRVDLAGNEEWLVDRIDRWIRLNDKNCVIAREEYAKPDDPATKNSTQRRIYVEDEVYLVAQRPYDDRQEVGELVKWVGSPWKNIGILTTTPQPGRFIDLESRVNREELTKLASASEMLFVTAFDAEGFLLWERNRTG